LRTAARIREGKAPLIYGGGSTSMYFVYVKDIAKANIAALQADVSDETFNIGNQVEPSLKQLLQVLLQVNQSDLKPEHREENTINQVSRRLADITAAKQKIDFTPTVPLAQGLAELSQWYFEKQKK